MSNKALVTQKVGDVFNTVIKNIEMPILKDEEILIEVSYSSLNYKDALSSIGNPGVTRNYPHITGIDLAGVIKESKSDKFKANDRVVVTGFDMGMNTDGGHAQFVKIPAKWAIKTPENISDKEIMTYGTAGFTAALSILELLENNINPESGEILVTGATGGVGSVAVSILAKAGYDVVAVTGKMDKEGFLKSLGAKSVIERSALSLQKRPLISTKWAGIVDTVGGDILAEALKALQYNGVATCCGLTSSANLNTTVFPFILRGVRLIGIDSVECSIDKRVKTWNKLATEWKLDNLEDLATVVKLEEVPAIYKEFINSKVTGRYVVKIK